MSREILDSDVKGYMGQFGGKNKRRTLKNNKKTNRKRNKGKNTTKVKKSRKRKTIGYSDVTQVVHEAKHQIKTPGTRVGLLL